MSINSLTDKKTNKSCLLVFRNRRDNDFVNTTEILNVMSGFGYFFDNVSFSAYNDSEEIVRAIKEGKENYANVVICCPKDMEGAVKKFVGTLYGKPFDELGVLKAGVESVFLLYTDKENKLQFKDVKKVLDAKYGVKYENTCIKAVGAPASKINAAIKAAKSVSSELDFNVIEKYGDVRIDVIYTNKTSKMMLDEATRAIVGILNEYIYAIEDVSLTQRLFQLLKLRRMSMSVAESFTGGGLSKSLVEVPGISSVFYEGLNTYSNEAKIKRLGVQEITLKQYGAVSPQTAYEMAEGLLNTGKCDISIATTGIAGPNSDNTKKPVGLSYIAIGSRDTVSVYKYNLKGDRENITRTAINLALFLAFKTLK